MGSTGQVHWGEGLYLLPHHFQVMQRDLGQRLAAAQRLTWGYHYGVVESRLSIDALQNFLIRFDRLHVVMPSGLELEYPGNVNLEPFNIKERFNSGNGDAFTINLAVPLWRHDSGNTSKQRQDSDTGASAAGEKFLYSVREVETADENTGENPKTISMRRINATLLLDGQESSGMEVIPLVRIVHATDADIGIPQDDRNFIPPCLVVEGSPRLRELLRDLADQVAAARQELALFMSKSGFSMAAMQGPQFEQAARLRILSRFSARVPHLVRAPSISPFQMYMELYEMLGELVALHPENDQFEVSPYNHSTPAISFLELNQKIRQLLRKQQNEVWQQKFAPLTLNGKPVLAVTMTDEQLQKPNGYFIAVVSKMDPKTVSALLQNDDKFKVVAPKFAHRPYYGMKLEYEPVAPPGLPPRAGTHYFRIDRDSNAGAWKDIVQARSIVVHWPEMEGTDLKDLTLFMTIPLAGDAT